ncbi:putative quinol monooxygenase [Kutzneria sp. 744]|uniref:putative quinol monooxygenase n=1 Tax=Kutzneria sp. (strain 744) TaxID=345341 RepID=UPI0003EEAD2B|nr:putative quinol monooxygenase [Kutzneria sp. 744]EWM11433.1 antibiotic biosynthesis monooxygenase [Kutzneria sp. 744]
MIFIVVKFTVRPELADSWPDIVADFTTSTRAEAGNVFFDWSRSVEDPTVYVLTEGFQDDAAEAHVTSAHFKTAMAELPKAIATTPQIINVTIPQAGWSEMAELKPV